jgi:hypothetical protein
MTTSITGPGDLDADSKIRCSDRSRAAALSPIGTAGSNDGFLLVEIPLPWPRDIGKSDLGAELGPILGPLRYRLQAVVPSDPAAPPEERRVILHARPPGEAAFSGYRRFESPIGSSLVETVRARVSAAALASGADLESPAVDVLVCSHGTRDSCCGRRGAGLAVGLAATDALDGVNLWRTSHLGGHRFAPTFLYLPDGTSWGYADLDLVTEVVRRTGDFTEVADHYRGCTGLEGPQVQAIELEVLRKIGWDLLDTPRTGSFDGTHASLSWWEGEESVTWAGEVRPGRAIPMPRCMEPVSPSSDSETEWDVTAVYRRQDAPGRSGENT